MTTGRRMVDITQQNNCVVLHDLSKMKRLCLGRVAFSRNFEVQETQQHQVVKSSWGSEDFIFQLPEKINEHDDELTLNGWKD